MGDGEAEQEFVRHRILNVKFYTLLPLETDSDSTETVYFRSLLIQRKGLSTAAVSSMDSNSIDSTGQDVLFASSMDSSGSDLEQRRLSLMNRHVTISTPHVGRMERDYR